MAENDITPNDTAPNDTPATPPSVDLGTFVPEQFKAEDGTWNTAGFRTSYDELASFKAQADEKASALPQEASGYAFAVPENHVFPEGFDPEIMKTTDDDGNVVEFDVQKMIKADDPDLPLLQAAMHKHGADPALMGELASIFANRELRGVMDGAKAAEEEKQELGPNAQQRFDTVTRALKAKLPEAQAKEIMDGVISADALRGLEKLLGSGGNPPPPVNGGKDYADMKPIDRLMAGLTNRK